MANRPGHHTPLENAHSIADVQEILAARAATVADADLKQIQSILTVVGGAIVHDAGVPKVK